MLLYSCTQISLNVFTNKFCLLDQIIDEGACHYLCVKQLTSIFEIKPNSDYNNLIQYTYYNVCIVLLFL